MKIPFNRMTITDLEKKYVLDCLESRRLCGDNKYTKLVEEKFKELYNLPILLTTSCSSALDMSAIVSNIKTGDEIILPSFTFVSTANAFVLRGAKPVFVDIDPRTMNIDANKIEEKITKKTKAIVVVHYAGVACEMNKIEEICQKYNLLLIEDAAQAIDSYYNGKLLGTIGDYGSYSFHETKNVGMGEGGLLIVKNPEKFILAEMVREKGTNRKQFFKGFVDKYTWQVPGSSFLPSDLLSAVLFGQLERIKEIQEKRISIWNKYNKYFEKFEQDGLVTRPYIPEYATNNAHMYYLIFKDSETRDEAINFYKENGIETPFHYIPLHLSKVGEGFGYKKGDLPLTEEYSNRLIRMPMYYDLTEEEINYIFEVSDKLFDRLTK